MREGYKDPVSSAGWPVSGPANEYAPEPVEPEGDESSWALSDAEQVAIGRLRSAAVRAGMPLSSFVDMLLTGHDTPPPPPSREAAALVSEVKGLLEKLASDLPSKVAISMSETLRAAQAREQVSSRTAGSARTEPVPVLPPTGAVRHVATYRSRRAKAPRLAL